MAVVVAEGKCVWLHVGGGFWPRRPCRWGKVSWKGEERGSPLACNRDFVALHTARTGQWGQSLSDTFLFLSKLSNQMIIADSLVCTNRSHDLVWVTNGTPKLLFRAAGARKLGLNWTWGAPGCPCPLAVGCTCLIDIHNSPQQRVFPVSKCQWRKSNESSGRTRGQRSQPQRLDARSGGTYSHGRVGFALVWEVLVVCLSTEHVRAACVVPV